MSSRNTIALTIAGGLLLAATSIAATEPPTLGDKVVEYCKANLEKKVGSGQCAALAGQALKAAGAKLRGGPDSPNKGDYVWGKQVYFLEAAPGAPKETGKLKAVHPGDIVQYRDTRCGRAHFPHHTSVVADVDQDERRVKVYQQNVNGKQIVMQGVLNLDKLTEGWIRIYRPVR